MTAPDPALGGIASLTWSRRLSRLLAAEVEVSYGRSRTRPVVLHSSGRRHRLRLHRLFCAAPDEVVEAMAEWIGSGGCSRGAAAARIDAFLDAALDALPPRRHAGSAQGLVHDLDALARDLLPWFADGELEPPPHLCWGRRGRGRRGLQLGIYDPVERTVRIHPALDQPFVPGWFVASVLYHELLHAALPPRRDAAGRWIKHGPEFLARERAHPDHARAEAWLDRHLTVLLRRRR